MLLLWYRKGSWAAVINFQDFIINGVALGAIAFIGTLVISIVRAPALLDKDLKSENEALEAKLASIQNRERPAIVFKRSWTDERSFEAQPNTAFSSLNLLFGNGADGLSDDCIARNVIANIQFLDSSDDLLCEVDAGRWGDADQPCDRKISLVTLRRAEFSIGDTRELNLAIKFFSDGHCYGLDNDYVATGGTKPSLQIMEGIITARVRLRGIGVCSEWIIRFENPPCGSLRLISAEAATQERR